jgi:NADH-quinone oxidoreductase subunit N
VRTFDNLLTFSPELWLIGGALVVFLLARFAPSAPTRAVALLTLLAAFLALATQFKSTLLMLNGAFLLDGFAIFIDVIVLAAAALTLLAGRADVLLGESEPPAFPGFLLLATLGAMLAASAAEMVAVVVALELLAINLYVMSALARPGRGVSASLGYLAAGMASSAILVYGLALLYGLSGDTRLAAVGRALALLAPTRPALLLAFALLVAGLAIRIGLVPVRWWSRGFESGVPLRVIMYVLAPSVVAAFAVFARLTVSLLVSTRVFPVIVAVIAAIAMTAGNGFALSQASVRRQLAYASIAQAGFALASFTDLKRQGVPALLIFLVALALTNLATFSVVIAYARVVHSDAIRDLAGMARFAPGLALALAIAVASLIGLPPVAGFFGKLFVIQAAIDGGYVWLAAIAAFNLVFMAFGYLRILKVALVDAPLYEVASVRFDRGIQTTIALTSAALVFLGVLLGPLFAAASYARAALLR